MASKRVTPASPPSHSTSKRSDDSDLMRQSDSNPAVSSVPASILSREEFVRQKLSNSNGDIIEYMYLKALLHYGQESADFIRHVLEHPDPSIQYNGRGEKMYNSDGERIA